MYSMGTPRTPTKPDDPKVYATVRMSNSLLMRVNRLAFELNWTKTKVIEEAIQEYLDNHSESGNLNNVN